MKVVERLPVVYNTLLGEIGIGECFRICGYKTLYMRILLHPGISNSLPSRIYAVELANGVVVDYSSSAPVVAVRAEVHEVLL